MSTTRQKIWKSGASLKLHKNPRAWGHWLWNQETKKSERDRWANLNRNSTKLSYLMHSICSRPSRTMQADLHAHFNPENSQSGPNDWPAPSNAPQLRQNCNPTRPLPPHDPLIHGFAAYPQTLKLQTSPCSKVLHKKPAKRSQESHQKPQSW